LWQNEATAWYVGHYLIMPDHLHFFCAPRDLHFGIDQ
jgi:putative transposase